VGSNVAYVGFGGGSGGLTAVQDILNWTFTTQDPGQPGGGSPAMATTASTPTATASTAVMAAPAAAASTDPPSSTTTASGAPASAPSKGSASPATVARVIPQSVGETAALDAVLKSYAAGPKSRRSALVRLVTF
jgi:hypothetical protein